MLSDPTTYVCLLYLALLTAAGLVVALRVRDRLLIEYFLAGKLTGSVVLGLSLCATTIGGIGVLFLLNPDFQSRASALLALAILFVLLAMLGLVIAPKYLSARVLTSPGLIAWRFGPSAGTALGAVFLLMIVLVRLPMMLLGGSWALSALTGWEPLTTAMLVLVVAGLYATAGGFASVVFTQAIQGAAVIASAAFLLILMVLGYPCFIEDSFAVVTGMSPLTAALTLASLAVVAIWYFWADQFVLHRVLSARSEGAARKGILLAVALVMVVALAGYASVGSGRAPEVTSPAHPLSTMIGAVMVLSLMLAAVAGLLQSAATLIALDIVRPFQRTATDQSVVLVGRLSATAVAVVVLLLVSAMGPLSPGGLLRFVDAHLAVAPPIAALFVGVLFVRRMTVRAAAAAMFTGAALGLTFVSLPAEWNLPAEMFAVVSFGVSMAALLGVSFLAAGPAVVSAAEREAVGVKSEHADVVVS